MAPKTICNHMLKMAGTGYGRTRIDSKETYWKLTICQAPC